MAISADQSAVLEMLLGGGQDYSDLDDLFGLDEGETRDRARAALEEIGGQDPDRNVALGDYILGQADHIDRADAARHLRQDPDDSALASAIVSELAGLFPGAELPSIPRPTGKRAKVKKAPASKPVADSLGKDAGPAGEPLPADDTGLILSADRTRLMGVLGGAAIILIMVVLAIAGVFSGSDDEGTVLEDQPVTSAEDAEGDPSAPTGNGGAGDQEFTRIGLAPVGETKARGAAVVGATSGDQPYLDLTLQNLDPAPDDRGYLVWFMFDDTRGYPLEQIIVPDKKGGYEQRIVIPLEVAGALSQSVAIEVSLSSPKDVTSAIEDAADEGTFAITVPGDVIVKGDVPMVDPGQEDQSAPGEGAPREGG